MGAGTDKYLTAISMSSRGERKVPYWQTGWDGIHISFPRTMKTEE